MEETNQRKTQKQVPLDNDGKSNTLTLDYYCSVAYNQGCFEDRILQEKS